MAKKKQTETMILDYVSEGCGYFQDPQVQIGGKSLRWIKRENRPVWLKPGMCIEVELRDEVYIPVCQVQP